LEKEKIKETHLNESSSAASRAITLSAWYLLLHIDGRSQLGNWAYRQLAQNRQNNLTSCTRTDCTSQKTPRMPKAANPWMVSQVPKEPSGPSRFIEKPAISAKVFVVTRSPLRRGLRTRCEAFTSLLCAQAAGRSYCRGLRLA